MATWEDHFKKALDFQERNLFDLAIGEYLKALDLEPENLDVMVNLGAAYLQKGLPERSTQVLIKALNQKPDHPLALFNIGKAYLYREEMEKALLAFEKAEKVLPDDDEVKKSMGQCLILLGRKEEAVNLLLPMKTQFASDTATILMLGRTLMEIGQYTEALDVFRKAVTASPDSAEALDGLIRCQSKLGMKEKAMTSLRRALMVHPQDPNFNLLMVDQLIEAGEIDEGLNVLKRSLNANPAHPLLRSKMEEISRRLPILKKKSGAPELVDKQSPFETEVYDILDGLYDGRIGLDTAITTMKGVRAKDPSDLFIADELANLLFQAKRYEESLSLYGEIQKSAPHESRHRINFAKCLALSGNIPLAQEFIQDAMNEFPIDLELPLALVELKLFERDYYNANLVLEKAMLKQPDNVHGMFLHGYISLRIGNLDFAADTFKKLIRLTPDDEEVVVWYSRLMILLDKPGVALEAWNNFNDGIKTLLEILTKIELCLSMGEFGRVKDLLMEVDDFEPRFLDDHLMLGKACFYARDYKSALDEMELVLKQDPDHPEALSFAAIIYLMKSKTARFWMLWQKAIESDSFYPVVISLILAKTINQPQLDKLKDETRKIYDISTRNELDRARLSLLLKKLS